MITNFFFKNENRKFKNKNWLKILTKTIISNYNETKITLVRLINEIPLQNIMTLVLES